MTNEDFRAGYAAILGRPNVGKSTLLNALLGQKISITSPKPQTTRHRFAGILSTERFQAVLLDTPGLLNPKYELHQYMLNVALQSLESADIIIYLVESHDKPENLLTKLPPKAQSIFAQKFKTPRILAINKLDLIHKPSLLPLIESYHQLQIFADIIPISALQTTGLDRLQEVLFKYLPHNPPFFPEDQLSTESERFIAGEMVREKVFLNTRDEVPYASTVLVEAFKERDNGFYIYAVIYVQKSSQKGVIIGKGGSMLRQIGQEARQEIETFLGRPVYLDLWVKVRQDWSRRATDLGYFGYR